MITSLETIKDLLSKIIEQIKYAERIRGGNQGAVTLVAVSKKQSVQKMQAYEIAAKEFSVPVVFGENYVQEFQEKKTHLSSESKCHLIGPLQSNKVRAAVALFDVIQSVHSEKILFLVNKEAEKINKIQEILLQINVSDDPQKSGFSISELPNAIQSILTCSNVKCSGVMAITALHESIEQTRADFRRVRECAQVFSSELQLENKVIVSMGMSADFEVAIQEHATHIRVGTALFGER